MNMWVLLLYISLGTLDRTFCGGYVRFVPNCLLIKIVINSL